MLRLLGLGAAFVLGCSPASSISIEITTGQETDAFKASPAVTEVDITATGLNDGDKLTAKSTPGGTFDLGDADSTDLYTITVSGLSASGSEVVGGTSLSLSPSSIDGTVWPVFAGRVDAWARPPDALVRTHVNAIATVASERFLMLVGGDEAIDRKGEKSSVSNPDYYDLVTLSGATASTSLMTTPLTAVGLGDTALLIDDGGATWLSFQDGTTGPATLPDGLLSFGDVAGGREVDAPDGRVFVIGGARTPCRQPNSPNPTCATNGVLVIATDGTLSGMILRHPRAGAAAAWIQGVGLVVAGGSATAPDGVEVLGADAGGFSSRPFPTDATVGAAVGGTPSGVVLVGGADALGKGVPTRLFDPTCTSHCTATAKTRLALPDAIEGAQAFILGGSRLLVVGHETNGGHLRSFEVDVGGSTVTDIPLREPRTGASFVAAPNATLAVLGGLHDDGSAAVDVEILFPK